MKDLHRCNISQTCRTLHNFTSTLYSAFDFPLSPNKITSLAQKRQSIVTADNFQSVPTILVRSGVYNIAIGFSNGDDYSAIFFNKKCIVRVVKVKHPKSSSSKNRILQIESPKGKDYFAHTSTLNDILEKYGLIAIRRNYGVVSMIRRFRQRDQASTKEPQKISSSGNQRWFIKVLTQFHYRYLICQQKLYVYGTSLKNRHQEIINFLDIEFKNSLKKTYQSYWSIINKKKSPQCLATKLSNSLGSSSNCSINNDDGYDGNFEKFITMTEMEQQLAQLNERHLFLGTLMERFKSVILENQSLDSCFMVFRNYNLQTLYESLRTNLTKVLHKYDKVVVVIDELSTKFQNLLKQLYEQDMRNKYAILNKELSSQDYYDISAEGILEALLVQVPYENIFSRKMTIKNMAQRHFETMCSEYGDHTARIDYDDYCSSSNEDLSEDNYTNNRGNGNGSYNCYNNKSYFYDIKTGQHVSQDYAKQFFIDWFEQNCVKFCNRLLEAGDWLNAICYMLFMAKLLLKDECHWVEQYDESEGVFTNTITEWRFEIVERIENELKKLTKDVVGPSLKKGECINGDDMNRIWKTWWLYACSEVLDGLETIDKVLADSLPWSRLPNLLYAFLSSTVE
ncbi:9033_t:CDS:2 [Entrophospora sp. SA101]|nr:9033_t:CDS:2 [Entrophospora sp. SA101]CAJ0915864.1 5586_t:CDS:2 [Entrophospora sp. SA101]